MIDAALEVRQGSATYPVYVGGGVRAQLGALADELELPPRRVVIISRRVAELYADSIRASIPDAAWLEFGDGESEKTLDNVAGLLTRMLEAGLRRDTLAFVVGGGVTGDAAGFAASIFMRGIPFIHVPTTLLSQVDSSIGGKLGVNHVLGKNLLGSFAAPQAVVSDTDFLATLEDSEVRSGLFEALKSGVIGDRNLFESIASSDVATLAAAADRLQQIVRSAVAVKADIVSRDERESGERRLLNYGHTLGHAIETALDYRGITHGEAVGWGMIAANAIAVRRGVLQPEVARRIDAAILAIGPARPRGLDPDTLLQAAGFDKKFLQGRRNYVVAEAIGRCSVIDVSVEDLRFGTDRMLEAIAG